ncbi:MAG TPA: CDP-alcohol phosphatidyltransferase family protein [Chthoniobacterales bacterium]|jgi:hypothetical protein
MFAANRPAGFLILADEAAAWRIAGLTQLDRLVLALNEWVRATWPAEIVPAVIFWQPEVAASSRWLPRHPRMTHVRLTESLKSTPLGAQVLDARLFVHRNGMANYLEATPPVCIEGVPEETTTVWSQLRERFKTETGPGLAKSPKPSWRYVASMETIARCEEELLSRSGKSQDGIVSRFLNRPLSRRVTRFLFRFDLRPTALSISLFILPVAAFFCLVRGDYGGIVAGAFLFQFYSILDGCDGEIARATYQESDRGGRIDDFLDMLGSIVFVIGLGFGLFRSQSSVYLLEGFLCAAVIAVNEWFLRRDETAVQPDSAKLTDALYPRHRRLLAGQGRGFFSEKFLWWVIQFTKRDVAILLFLILALLDQSPWILHLWLTVSAATLALSMRSSTGKTGVAESEP